jgi:hypothetical protein
VPTLDIFTLSRIFEAKYFARLLPIIFNIREVKITDSYHKLWGLTRIGVGCEGDWDYFVVMILCILQDIWVGVGWVGVEI